MTEHNHKEKIFWCKNCLNASTRPRIEFDSRGWCNACQWMEKKKNLDWTFRKKELQKIVEYCRSHPSEFDCIVPVSGGKDGSAVSYKLKHEYGLNPLTVTIAPPLSLELGNTNLQNFIDSGYTHIRISPDSEAMRILNRKGFEMKGFPYYGWLTAVYSGVVRTALNYNVPMIFYGEDGEVEYGGLPNAKNEFIFDVDYMRKIYLEAGQDKVLAASGLSDSELYFFSFPSENDIKKIGVKATHWSNYENWDPYKNYMLAKEYCGLQEADNTNSGTFTNFAQNDQALYALHTYVMYLKFGFGRATQDAGIEIRRGAMTRDQGLNLVHLYDGHYPEEFIDTYLNYYQMTNEEFDTVLDTWVNKDLFSKENGRWQPKFTVK